jgi:hypothetical protein
MHAFSPRFIVSVLCACALVGAQALEIELQSKLSEHIRVSGAEKTEIGDTQTIYRGKLTLAAKFPTGNTEPIQAQCSAVTWKSGIAGTALLKGCTFVQVGSVTHRPLDQSATLQITSDGKLKFEGKWQTVVN